MKIAKISITLMPVASFVNGSCHSTQHRCLSLTPPRPPSRRSSFPRPTSSTTSSRPMIQLILSYSHHLQPNSKNRSRAHGLPELSCLNSYLVKYLSLRRIGECLQSGNVVDRQFPACQEILINAKS